MLTYHYTAKEGPKKRVKGVIEAENETTAIRKIIASGFMPMEINVMARPQERITEESSSLRFQWLRSFSAKSVKLRDIAAFTQEMSDLIDASVPIVKSLQLIAQQTKKGFWKEVVEKMYGYVRDGGSFAGALAQHPKIFSPFYINMVKTGEAGSPLEKVLARLAVYLQKQQETKGKVSSSLAYPAFLLGVGMITMFVLLTFVIPRLATMFDDLDQALPLPTIMVTNLSSFCAHYWWLILGIIILTGTFVGKVLRTPKGRRWFDHLQLRAPVFGEFVVALEAGRFARTLGTLVESGVPIHLALDSVGRTMDNVVLKEEIQKVSQEVLNGASLKKALRQCPFFPESATNVVAVGEETGHLDKSLYKIADTYERKTDQAVKTMLSLLGPLCLVAIVSVIGFVVIALLLPIFQMNLLIQ